MRDAIDATLTFWFGTLTPDGVPEDDRTAWWFTKDAAQDAAIRRRFGGQVHDALAGALDPWAGTGTGRLALVVTLDQFTRNIGRDTPDAFAGDDRALALTLDALEIGADDALAPIHRVFLYMPLEHAEDEAMQELSVACFRALEADAPETHRGQFRNFTAYAEAHRDVIRRFGRFPHRNAILGRENTTAEAEYLAQPGAGF